MFCDIPVKYLPIFTDGDLMQEHIGLNIVGRGLGNLEIINAISL